MFQRQFCACDIHKKKSGLDPGSVGGLDFFPGGLESADTLTGKLSYKKPGSATCANLENTAP